jgi:hypothetical protein
LDSVPPLVNTMRSAFFAPKSSPIRSRASSKTRRARRPNSCWLAGFKSGSAQQARIASATSGKSGVVAL